MYLTIKQSGPVAIQTGKMGEVNFPKMSPTRICHHIQDPRHSSAAYCILAQ